MIPTIQEGVSRYPMQPDVTLVNNITFFEIERIKFGYSTSGRKGRTLQDHYDLSNP